MPCQSGPSLSEQLRKSYSDFTDLEKRLLVAEKKSAEREAMLCAILKQLETNYISKDGKMCYFIFNLAGFCEFLNSAEQNGELKPSDYPNIKSFFKKHVSNDKEKLAKKLKETFSAHERQMISEMVEGGII